MRFDLEIAYESAHCRLWRGTLGPSVARQSLDDVVCLLVVDLERFLATLFRITAQNVKHLWLEIWV